MEEVIKKCSDGSCTFAIEPEYNFENLDETQELYSMGTIVTWGSVDEEDSNSAKKQSSGDEQTPENNQLSDDKQPLANGGAGYAEIIVTISNAPEDESVTGRAKIVKVVSAGTKPDRILVNLGVNSSNSRSGSYKRETGATFEFDKSDIYTGSNSDWYFYKVSKTKFWKTDGKANVYINGGIGASFGVGESPVLLLNKVGQRYPQHTDPLSKKEMTEPSTTTWSKTSESGCRMETSEKKKYRDWYDKSFGAIKWFNPDGTHNYDIHHIRPCAYGGTKNWDNLMPLPIGFHKVVTKWWTNYWIVNTKLDRFLKCNFFVP